jgi:hypothetical protein
MPTNLDRYKDDLNKLISLGGKLVNSLQNQFHPEEFKAAVEAELGAKADAFLKSKHLLTGGEFATEYQCWYSEAKVLIKQLLPERLDDFVRHYEKPKTRKSIS